VNDQNWPPLPPPPPTTPQPPSYATAPPYGYPSMPVGAPPTAPKKSSSGLWIGLGVVVAIGVGAAIWMSTSGSDGAAKPAVVSSSVAPPAQGVDVSGPSGWVMTISPDWAEAPPTSDAAEGSWTTGGGDATFTSFANVYVETPQGDITLADYIQISKTNMPTQLPGAVMVSNDILRFGDQDVARFEYSGVVSGVATHFLAYIVKADGNFVVATFAAPESLFASEAPLVEPYLSTLREQ